MAKHSVLTLLAAAMLWAAVGGVVHSAEPSADAASLRRTPVVDVFEKWNDAVMYVTGPVARGEKAAIEEFFVTDGRMLKENSVGTGFAIHKSGFVVTNAHGVEKMVGHAVILANGKALAAEPIAVSHEQDISLLRVRGSQSLKPVRLARSGDLLIGETVVVIGNPLGLRNTCTVGVLGAVGRTTQFADLPGVTLRETLQSDAAINPGSSGGPWFNLVGDVVGMTASMKREAQNVAFAVSAATLRKIVPRMLNVERRFEFSSGLRVSPDGRCEVVVVEPDSPAAKAGIRRGDLIVGLGGQPLETSFDFHLGLIGRKAGETLSCDVLREGKLEKVSFTLAPRPKPDARRILKQKLGIEAEAIDAATAKGMGLRVVRGLVVTAVDAAVYGALDHRPHAGDVLVRIGAVRPRNLDQAAEVVENLSPGDAIDLVLVRRRDNVATRTDVHLVLPR